MVSKNLFKGLCVNNGKYETDFESHRKVARGGFSSVYEARHKIDQQLYAIKKIVLRVTTKNYSHIQENLDEILKEVRLFAAIKSPHIISYMHSWIEVTYAPHSQKLPVEDEPAETDYDPDVQLVSPDVEFGSRSIGTESESEPAEKEFAKPSIEKITLFIQMELCQKTLEEFLNADTTCDYDTRLRVAYQIVKALSVIHNDYGLIHRDITPRNIFFAQDGTVKIGDFGLATSCKHLVRDFASPFISSVPVEEQEDEIKDLNLGESIMSDFEDTKEPEEDFCTKKKRGLTNGIGTKEYASPEQMSGTHYDQRTDIYSLGLIFLSLFSPTKTQSERYTQVRNCRVGKLPAGFSEKYPQLACLIQSMVSLDPSARPTDSELLKNPVFLRFRCDCESGVSPRSAEDQKQNQTQEALVTIGKKGKLKKMYVKVIGGKLLGYKKPDKKKARFCYPLTECKINTTYLRAIFCGSEPIVQVVKESPSSEFELLADVLEMKDTEGEDERHKYIISHDVVLEISHPELETLYLMINEEHLLIKEICNG